MSVRDATEIAPVEAGDGARGAAAFEQELMPLLLPAYRLAVAMVFDPALAEDAVQDAALRAWHHRAKRRAGTDMRPWFLAIVANRCREARRSRWQRVLLVATLPEQPARVDEAADGIDLCGALKRLPRQNRLAVVLRFYLDLSYEDVAAVLGCSVNAAKLRVSRSAAALRRLLREREVAE